MWEYLWSTAREVLKLSAAEFWELTPRQYHLLLERHRDKQKHTEWLVGVLTSTVVNWSMVPAPKEPLRPRDFPFPMLQEREKKPRINRKKIAGRILANFDREMARMGGA